MIDYEQKYYDLLYKIKKLETENVQLKEENKLLKKYMKNKNLKEIIINEIVKYKKEKK